MGTQILVQKRTVDLEILHEQSPTRICQWAEMEPEAECYQSLRLLQFAKMALPEKRLMVVMKCDKGAAIWMVRSVLYDR